MVEMSGQEFRILYGTERDSRNQTETVPVTVRNKRRNRVEKETKDSVVLRIHVPFTHLHLSLENKEYPAACC